MVGVDLVGVPVRPPRMFPTVFPTPERSPWALAPPMPTSMQTTTTRRCIFQMRIRDASEPRKYQYSTYRQGLRVPRVVLRMCSVFNRRSWVCDCDVRR